MLTSAEGHPLGPVPFHQWEVEHVHHPTVEHRVVASAPWHKLCHDGCRRIVENHTIEQAVDDIARSTGKDEGEACQEEIVHSLLYLPAYNIYKEDHGNYAERGEEELIYKFHAECHAAILGEENLEPWGYLYDLVHVHAGLHPYLDCLVYDNSRQRYAGGCYNLILPSTHAKMEWLDLFHCYCITCETYLCGKYLACNIVIVCIKAGTSFLCIRQSDNNAIGNLETAVLTQLLN